jgi:predicted transcriptional regulator
LKAIKTLREMVKPSAPGPVPSFTEHHLIRALNLIGERGKVGRGALSSHLGLGEGSTRTIIEHLKEANLAFVSREGCELTEKGKRVFREIKAWIKEMKEIDQTGSELGKYNVGVLVKGVADRVRLGIEQRDAAVKAGAKGAVTMVYRKGLLFIPPSEEVKGEWVEPVRRIIDLFKPEDLDVIILCGADSKGDAENAVIAAALTLINNKAK